MAPENDVPLTDDQVRGMGFEPGPKGWAPTRPSAEIPDPQLPEPEDVESPPELPLEVNIAKRCRRAARVVVRSRKGDLRERLVALVELAEAARRKPEADLGQGAIWTEGKRFIRGKPEPEMPALGDPVENAIRRLLHDCYSRCPTCRRPLPDERELDRWRRRRLAEIEEVRQFEEAVE